MRDKPIIFILKKQSGVGAKIQDIHASRSDTVLLSRPELNDENEI